MDANELRRAFLSFFEARDHTIVPSASLIPHDPSLLFTVAGMVPFKPYFVGDEVPPFRRAASVQRCVRAGGKHNDLDAIGRSSRHLSFFEMLGNFSFGDYFKPEAIAWAWELVTAELGLDPERLWVTVHTDDDEAADIWRDGVGLAPERIQRLDEDNFWRMADIGPCGPSSEIFWDNGPQAGEGGGPAHGSEDRFIEIWNLVFMQFEERGGGERFELPRPSIDTGAGLERILAVLQGVDSVYDTDEFVRLLDAASSATGVAYGTAPGTDVSLRILAEHARSMTFLVSDGVIPSNEDRGYVLRRIIRRAVRHAYLLGVEQVVAPDLVAAVVEVMGADYPELVSGLDGVQATVEREEGRFRQTLKTGSAILDDAIAEIGPTDPLPGSVAFQLHDTYGFPLEVTREILEEQGRTVDEDGFEVEMAQQRTRAKQARRAGSSEASTEDFQQVLEVHGLTTFTGRSEDVTEATVLAVVGDAVVLDRTPFYAESGGQVGDTGIITTSTGRAEVLDTTYAIPGIHRHVVRVVEGTIEPGQDARARIDVGRRAAIRRNHTATHLLHWALRQVLGEQLKQQGSMVGPDRLRFDFNHHEALTDEQMATIEDLVASEVLANAPVRHFETTKQEAEALGAIAFFGDKYGDVVRVLEAGASSTELCGGTHVRATGDIGLLKIVAEGSIGANLRRVEAITGFGPLQRLREDEARLSEAAALIGVPTDELADGIVKRLGELRDLRDEVRDLRRAAAVGMAGALADGAVDGIVVARVDELDRDGLRDLALAVRDRSGVRAVVLGGAPDGGGVALVAAVRDDAGLHAGELLSDAAKAVGGGGRPSPDLATAGGREPEHLDAALALARAAAGLDG